MKKELVGVFIVILAVFFSLLIIIKKGLKGQSLSTTGGLHEASFYEELEDGKVRCNLCPNRCILAVGQRGLCKVRENIEGKLYSLVYGKPVSVQVDPMEKKPLYHFLPASKVYSLATAGCNLQCKYCQNWDIAQRDPEDLESMPMSPEEVVSAARESGSEAIAFTYNEPIVWYEYMLDIAKLAKEEGLKTVMISSGYIEQEPLKELLPFLDAVKVDLKSFNDEVYQQLIGGRMEPVLETIKTVKKDGTWLELVHLVVPGYTDDMEEIEKMCGWVKDNVGEDVPMHFSRFWPKYKLLNLPPTSEDTVKEARLRCMEAGLKYVYTGNIADETGSTTYCPDNQEPVVRRYGQSVLENRLDASGQADGCASLIPGVWN